MPRWLGVSICRKPYPSDVSDEEWALVAPCLILLPDAAGQRVHSLREVFNGLRYIVKTGAPLTPRWRQRGRLRRACLVRRGNVCDGRRWHGAGEPVLASGCVPVPEMGPWRSSPGVVRLRDEATLRVRN